MAREAELGSQPPSLKAFLLFLHLHLDRWILFMQLQELPKSEEGANLFRPTGSQKCQRKKISRSRASKAEGRSKGMGTDARPQSNTRKMLWAAALGNAVAWEKTEGSPVQQISGSNKRLWNLKGFNFLTLNTF